ncbi:MAG: cysteine desulfurase family protein [Patescibacteria group bacterium]|nr:cysteine desulfurase family protein [Patescibacteria group bacterium]
MNRIYFDNAATTPIDKEVKNIMEPYFNVKYGNPNSLHFFGQEAKKAIDESREKIAKSIGADFRNIIFTGSATEANNLAIRGIVQGIGCQISNIRPRIIVSAIEHESVLETAKELENEGIETVILPVDKNGFVNLKKLKEFLDEKTILVSIIYANNEIGAIQNIPAIKKIIEKFKIEKLKNLDKKNLPILQSFNQQYPFLHTDAAQAFQFLDCNVKNLGVDLMTLSAHKIYGPKGIGALYMRRNNELRIKNNNSNSSIIHNSKFIIPLITGGGQEFGLRSGTENVPCITGFNKAIELASKNREKESKRIFGLRNYFWKNLKKIYPRAEINGIKKNTNYQLPIILPNILNIYFPGYLSDELLIKLDLNGIAVSSGSACSSFSAKPSHVLKALQKSDKIINSSVRFSFGKFTDEKQISESLKIIKQIL